MQPRDEGVPAALRPAEKRACAVLVSARTSDAVQVDRALLKLNTGSIVAYHRLADLLDNPPVGRVVLTIVATQDPPGEIRRALCCLRHRWPRSPLVVVSDQGCGEHEMAARECGANYLVRPIASQQWLSLLGHAFGRTYQVV